MAVSWQIEGSVVVIVLDGLYSNEDMEQALAAALADPHFEPGMALLMDARRSQTPLSSADIEWRLSLIETLPARGLLPRVAYLIREEQRTLTELARLEFRDPKAIGTVDIGFYTDLSEAIGWLGQMAGQPEPAHKL